MSFKSCVLSRIRVLVILIVRSCLPKNSFLKVCASSSLFRPSVAHGKLSARGRCVQATKNKAETCSLLDAIGRRSCGRWRVGIKIDVWKNPELYASTWDWSGLYGTMRCESETAAQSSCSHSESLWEHSGCLSSACIVVCAVNFAVTPAENFVSALSESSPSPRKHWKKKSVSPHDGQFIQANVRQSFQAPPLDCGFDRLKMSSSRPSARYHSCWRSWR